MKQHIAQKDLEYLAGRALNDRRDEIINLLKEETGLDYKENDIKWKNGEYYIPINLKILNNKQRNNLNELIKDAKDEDVYLNLIPMKDDMSKINNTKDTIIKNLNKTLGLNYTRNNVDYKDGVYKVEIDPELIDNRVSSLISKLIDSAEKQGIILEFNY